MGSCSSSTRRNTATAKLILEDGQLREFTWPVQASSLVDGNSGRFICSSETMQPGEFPAAMGGDDLLQLEVVYFVLPAACQSKRLVGEEMAMLAGKAAAAMVEAESRRHHHLGRGSCFCFLHSSNSIQGEMQ